MVPVVMEPACRNPKLWTGVVAGKLGGKLYVDLSGDVGCAAFADGVQRLANEIETVNALSGVTVGDDPAIAAHPQPSHLAQAPPVMSAEERPLEATKRGGMAGAVPSNMDEPRSDAKKSSACVVL